MQLRALGLVLTLTAACSSGTASGSGTTLASSPGAFTVSYRSKVRLPAGGTQLAADAFAQQLRTRDPIATLRCAPAESGSYADVSAFLGGVAWSHPVAILKNASYPPLYDGPIPPPAAAEDSAGASADRAPSIERPDLVAVRDGIGVFLSQTHGLLAVDARGDTPVPSCALKVPGRPKNFLVRGTELVILSNALSGAGAALLRYSFADGKLAFVDAVRLEDQTILDARLFDATIVTYTSWSEPKKQGTMQAMGAPASLPMPPVTGLGTKVTVVAWDDALAIDWQDSLLSDPVKTDPYDGAEPPTGYTAGQVAFENKTWASFIGASDRYLVVPRHVHRSRFESYRTMHYSTCQRWNPRDHQQTFCSTKYEQRPNPGYRAPDPLTGDYACNGKPLAECIQAAAPVVSRYVHVPVGQQCTTEWVGACSAYGSVTSTYPVFTYEDTTELTIYRFADGGFTKLDTTLAKLAPRRTRSASRPSRWRSRARSRRKGRSASRTASCTSSPTTRSRRSPSRTARCPT